MIAADVKTRQLTAQYALAILLGILSGGILLVNAALKWKIAYVAALGASALMAGNRKRIFLFIFASTVPFYFGKALIQRPGHLGLADGVGINHTDVLALVLLLLFLFKLALRQVEIRFFPLLTIAAFSWLFFSSLSLLTASDKGLVIIQLVNMAKLLLISLIIANSVDEEADVTWLLTGLMLGLLFQALVGAYQGMTGHPLGLDFLTEKSAVYKQELSIGLVNRVQGTLGHPNSFAMYITTVIPFSLAFLFCTRKRAFKFLAAVTISLGAVALVFSLSRIAWFNFLVVLGIILILAIRRKRISPRTGGLVAGASALILLALILFGPGLIRSRLTSNDQGSAFGRVRLARTALAIIKNHPLVGVGLNNYTLVNTQYDTTARIRNVTVHNVFLLIAAETGIVGLVAFLGLLAVLLIQTWGIISRAPTDTIWIAGVGIFAAFAALTVHGLVDYALLGSLQTITQFWLLVGLSAALTRGIDSKEQAERQFG